jgi:chemotaxis methyl-accepting protein methylase
MIFCRNVLILFDNDFTKGPSVLFDDSLANKGYLALEPKETIKYLSVQDKYSCKKKRHGRK